MIDAVIDIYHGETINFTQVSGAGIVGIIHKATQGATITDDRYADRHERARDLGFLWGAYHFGTGDDVAAQAENFLQFAQPARDELIAVDFEPNPDGTTMTLDQLEQFITNIHDALGRYPVVYGGSLLRDNLGSAQNP